MVECETCLRRAYNGTALPIPIETQKNDRLRQSECKVYRKDGGEAFGSFIWDGFIQLAMQQKDFW